MILFDSSSTSVASIAFSVTPTEVVLLSAFGIQPGQRATISKIRYEDGVMPKGDSCAGSVPLAAPTIVQSEDVTQCGTWHLDNCQNLGVLAVPGSYRLVLSDASMVGSVYIEAVELRHSGAALIPKDLFFGSIS